MRRILHLFFFSLFLGVTSIAQSVPRGNRIVLVVPFENVSKAPGIEWIGEAFADVLGNRMTAANLFVIRREDRIYAFDRLGIPSNVRPSRATLFRMAEEMDVDDIILGSFNFDGRTFTARAQCMDVKRMRLSPESVETGGLAQLVSIQDATAWDMLRELQSNPLPEKMTYVGAQTPVRLDALENYVRGTMALDVPAKIKFFKEAVRISPDYVQALFQLGKTYFDDKQYELATSWLAKVPRVSGQASEANFFLGIADYYIGNFDKAEEAFSFVAAHVPLIEVYNDLGVVAARRGKKTATESFERVVQADSRDADYRFNYAISLARSGDLSGAERQLKESLAIRPQDTEARSLLDTMSRSNAVPAKLPLERIKINYDETSYRQLAAEIQNANEERHGKMAPAEHAAAHVARGREFLQAGLLDQAENEFRQAILAYQNSVDAHAGLAATLEQQDQLPEARAEAVAANHVRFSPEAFLTLARIDLKQNKLESARDNADRALKLDPGNPAADELKKTIASQLANRTQSNQKN